MDKSFANAHKKQGGFLKTIFGASQSPYPKKSSQFILLCWGKWSVSVTELSSGKTIAKDMLYSLRK